MSQGNSKRNKASNGQHDLKDHQAAKSHRNNSPVSENNGKKTPISLDHNNVPINPHHPSQTVDLKNNPRDQSLDNHRPFERRYSRSNNANDTSAEVTHQDYHPPRPYYQHHDINNEDRQQQYDNINRNGSNTNLINNKHINEKDQILRQQHRHYNNHERESSYSEQQEHGYFPRHDINFGSRRYHRSFSLSPRTPTQYEKTESQQDGSYPHYSHYDQQQFQHYNPHQSSSHPVNDHQNYKSNSQQQKKDNHGEYHTRTDVPSSSPSRGVVMSNNTTSSTHRSSPYRTGYVPSDDNGFRSPPSSYDPNVANHNIGSNGTNGTTSSGGDDIAVHNGGYRGPPSCLKPPLLHDVTYSSTNRGPKTPNRTEQQQQVPTSPYPEMMHSSYPPSDRPFNTRNSSTISERGRGEHAYSRHGSSSLSHEVISPVIGGNGVSHHQGSGRTADNVQRDHYRYENNRDQRYDQQHSSYDQNRYHHDAQANTRPYDVHRYPTSKSDKSLSQYHPELPPRIIRQAISYDDYDNFHTQRGGNVYYENMNEKDNMNRYQGQDGNRGGHNYTMAKSSPQFGPVDHNKISSNAGTPEHRRSHSSEYPSPLGNNYGSRANIYHQAKHSDYNGIGVNQSFSMEEGSRSFGMHGFYDEKYHLSNDRLFHNSQYSHNHNGNFAHEFSGTNDSSLKYHHNQDDIYFEQGRDDYLRRNRYSNEEYFPSPQSSRRHNLLAAPRKAGDGSCVGTSKPTRKRKNSSPSTGKDGSSPVSNSSATPVSQRKRKKMYSDHVGVTYNKTHAKYQACITHYRKQHYLGRYKLAVDAARAYDESARLLKGKGWKINFKTEEDYQKAKREELEKLRSMEAKSKDNANDKEVDSKTSGDGDTAIKENISSEGRVKSDTENNKSINVETDDHKSITKSKPSIVPVVSPTGKSDDNCTTNSDSTSAGTQDESASDVSSPKGIMKSPGRSNDKSKNASLGGRDIPVTPNEDNKSATNRNIQKRSDHSGPATTLHVEKDICTTPLRTVSKDESFQEEDSCISCGKDGLSKKCEKKTDKTLEISGKTVKEASSQEKKEKQSVARHKRILSDSSASSSAKKDADDVPGGSGADKTNNKSSRSSSSTSKKKNPLVSPTSVMQNGTLEAASALMTLIRRT